ncbi:PAS domain-containing protein [Phenylobacterium sp. LjRoot219]|uniref:sensor histidine kinase n=1 Tax=Phenylobacterium sp. LjRoot219 TaxID=3342283 RepID=UPI003ECF995D
MHLSPDGQTRFLRVGASCQAILGVTSEALMTDERVLAGLILPEDRLRLLADKAAYATGRGPNSVEIRARPPGGDLRWFRLTSASRPSPDGGRLLDGLIIDITESKRLAEQLREERQRLEQAIELTGIGVFQWDRDDPETVLWSEHLYAMYGIPPQTPITVGSFRELVHPDDLGPTLAALDDAGDKPGAADLSFEHRIIRGDGQIRWVLQQLRVHSDAEGRKAIQGTTLDVTERRDAEEWRRLQMREIAHRSKNALTVMMAMVQQAARSSTTVEDLSERIVARLGAMAKSQDLASAANGAALTLPQLAGQVLDVFDLSRFDIDPRLEAVVLPGEVVIACALLLHELATNAVKYGALSAPDGRVALTLEPLPDGRAGVEWREHGGPRVTAPGRQGFGTRLLSTALQTRGGAVHPDFAPEGFTAHIEMPAS